MKKGFFLFLFIFLIFTPRTHAAMSAPFEVSGWVPYWRNATGSADILVHESAFKEINPFGYTVKADGTLVDSAHLDSAMWVYMQSIARGKQIRFIPTVMWSNAAAIDSVLSNPVSRKAHIKQIVSLVYSHDFDGIDIDYEGKYAETQSSFSQFLKELYKAMGPKWIVCDVEARTPNYARRDTSIDTLDQYANDYSALNKYCDRVRIMTYDQGQVDNQLNLAAGLTPYAPISDPQWVTKVINLAAQTISKKKLVIGIPTYGYEYTYSTSTTPNTGAYQYHLLWNFNPRYATELAGTLGITPQRSPAGEAYFIFTSTSTPPSQHILSWSDANAIQDKINLARTLGVRGVSIFKIDGGEDGELWTVLK